MSVVTPRSITQNLKIRTFLKRVCSSDATVVVTAEDLGSTGGIENSYDEIMKLLALMDWKEETRVEKGAKHALSDENTPEDSP